MLPLDDRAHEELEAAWEQYKIETEMLDKELEDARQRFEGPNVRYGPPGGDGQRAYENYNRMLAAYQQRAAEVEQKRRELRNGWNRLIARYGMPPRFP